MRFGVANSGASARSNWCACRPATMTSHPDGMYSRGTPSVCAIFSPRSAAAPIYLPVFGSWPNHGQAMATPARSLPAFLMASMVGLCPGAGTVCADAAPLITPIIDPVSKSPNVLRLILLSPLVLGSGSSLQRVHPRTVERDAETGPAGSAGEAVLDR